MSSSQLLSRISIDPNICFGKPCIKGHRIWVSLVSPMVQKCHENALLISQLSQLHENETG